MSVSVAQSVRDRVEAIGPGGFLHAEDVPGPRNGVDIALHRLAKNGDLVHAHRGLYWKPDGRRRQPSAAGIALELGGPGSGPSGVAAARMLGLTTQVPSVYAMAVPRRVQGSVPSVRFHQRPFGRREAGLNPMEVAVVEILRSRFAVIEEPIEAVASAVAEAAERGRIRPAVIAEIVQQERDRGARQMWRDIGGHADGLLAGAR